jgi:5-carboxymethyl-2-hydroxymuconic-semialdehyde dehydrogenase
MSELEDNLQRVAAVLAPYTADPMPHFIDGKAYRGRGSETFEAIAPCDNSVIGEVCAGSSADVDAASRAAEAAFPGWRAMDGAERRELLHAVADHIEAKATEIALVESYDSGQPLRFMREAALRGAANFRFFADRAPGARDGRHLPAAEHLNYTSRQPIGPVGVITPWNTPFMLATWKIAPALAAGCTVVHKPAEWSPYSAMLLAEIAQDAGLPAGVLNCVQGFGETAGKALTEHPAIKAIAFVGESRTGSYIMRQGAETLQRLHFELGGKNPVIVFDDADLDRALDAVVFMIYSLNGERCTSSSRLLIQESIHDEFVSRLMERIAKLRIGHPLNPDTEIGPLVHPRHLDKVRGISTRSAASSTMRRGKEPASPPVARSSRGSAISSSRRSTRMCRTACVSRGRKCSVRCSRPYRSRTRKMPGASRTIRTTGLPPTSGPATAHAVTASLQVSTPA